MLLLLCALLLVTGIGTTGAVLLEEEDEDEDEVDGLTVDGFALSMLVVGTGATTIVVLEEEDDGGGGGGAGLDVDVLLIGAGATVGVLETDTTGVLRDEIEDECELEGTAADELLAALLCEDRVEVVL